METYFAILAALGMLSSLAFAAWPTWFMDRLERRTRARIICKPVFSILALSGVSGWYAIFQAGAQSLLNLEGSTIATVLTGVVLLLIYSFALRGEAAVEEAKRKHQAERNASRLG